MGAACCLLTACDCPEVKTDCSDCPVVTDTVVVLPQCTLCYDKVDTVNGVQYYVGYDGKYYKLFKDSATIIRQVFVEFKDTTVIRYQVRDSVVTYINYVDTTQFFVITLSGLSTVCDGQYARPTLKVNGSTEKISGGGQITLDNADKEYIFNIGILYEEAKTITIEWNGDCFNDTGDRNVFIEYVKIYNTNYLTSDRTAFTGSVRWWSKYAYFSSNGSLTITL